MNWQPPADFQKLFRAEERLALVTDDEKAQVKKPTYYLWVFDPETSKVIIEHNENKHPAKIVNHEDLSKDVQHPHRVHGYAYPIKGGYRITDWEHKPVDDPFISKQVKNALAGHAQKISEYEIPGEPDFDETHYGRPTGK